MPRLPAQDPKQLSAIRSARALQRLQPVRDRAERIAELVGEHGEKLVAMTLLGLERLEESRGVERECDAEADVLERTQVGFAVATPGRAHAEGQRAVRLPVGPDRDDHDRSQPDLSPDRASLERIRPLLHPRLRDFRHEQRVAGSDHLRDRVIARWIRRFSCLKALGADRIGAGHRRLDERPLDE